MFRNFRTGTRCKFKSPYLPPPIFQSFSFQPRLEWISRKKKHISPSVYSLKLELML